MIDPAVDLRPALDRIAPSYEGLAADWDDVLRRAGTASPRRASGRSRLLVLAAAGLLGLVALSPFGYALSRTTVDWLTSWSDGEPGQPAPAEEARAFAEANATSYASFPSDAKVRLLAGRTAGSRRYHLLGFRDRDSLCLRVVRGDDPARRSDAASCVREALLRRSSDPVVVVDSADFFWSAAGRGREDVAVFGFVRNGVAAVDVTMKRSGTHPAVVAANAFLHVQRDPEAGDDRAFSVTAAWPDGASRTYTVLGLGTKDPPPDALPEPTGTALTWAGGAIAWIDGREPRGDPLEWPMASPRLQFEFARSIRPDPASSLRVGVGLIRQGGGGSSELHLCLTVLRPLLATGTRSFACGPWTGLDRSPLRILYGQEAGEQFPLIAGLAADSVSSLELYFAGGRRERVSLVDNVFAVQVARAELPAKLVAYDTRGAAIEAETFPGHTPAREEPITP